jgi:hypothetical protein
LQWKMWVYFMDIWSLLRLFDIFYDHLVYLFSPFWYIGPRKIWQPWSATHIWWPEAGS